MSTGTQSIPAINVRELQDRLEASDARSPLLLDVREDWEVAKCRIGDPLHIPLSQLDSRIGEIPQGRPIVVYCHHGGRSAHATALLRGAGYSQAANLAGGIHAWSTLIDPSVPTY